MTFQFSGVNDSLIATSGTILARHGIEVTISSNFNDYAEVIANERPAQKLGDPFNPDLHDLNKDTGFWLIGRNQQGDLVHTQAFKTIDLMGLSLSMYLRRMFHKFPPPIPGVDYSKSRYRASPGAHGISGSAIYHGEVWMAPEGTLYRGNGLSTVLTRYGMTEAISRWDPDWVFAFMLRAVVFKGFSERVGYMHAEPGALKWAVHGREQLIEAFLIYLSRQDARYMLDMPLDELVA